MLYEKFYSGSLFFFKVEFQNFSQKRIIFSVLKLWAAVFFSSILFSSFHLHPLLGLDLHKVGQPLCVMRLLLLERDSLSGQFFSLINVGNNPFTQRKESYSICSSRRCPSQRHVSKNQCHTF